MNTPNNSDNLEQSLESLVEQVDLASTQQQRPVDSTPILDNEKFIVFQLGGTRYAIPMEGVVEVQRRPAVTSIPNVPEWVAGVTNLRGEIISVSDLRSFLGMAPLDLSQTQRVIVVRSEAADLTTGLIVDRVIGIRSFATTDISTPAAHIDFEASAYLRGVIEQDRITVILELESLLQSTEMRQFESA